MTDIICDETNNTEADIAAGKLTADIEVPSQMRVVVEMEDGTEREMDIPFDQFVELVSFVETQREMS